jgi:hypothetical protein
MISLLFLPGAASGKDIFNRFIRLVLWGVSISITSYYYLDFNIFRKFLIRISVIATAYIIVQSLAWRVLNLYLPSVMNYGFIRPTSIGYDDSASLLSYYSKYYFRPGSFFAEPSFYSHYVLVGVAFLLFMKNNKQRHKLFLALFFSLGIFLSTSTFGICILMLVWGYFIYKSIKAPNTIIKCINIVILLISLIPVGFLIYVTFIEGGYGTNGSIDRLFMILNKPFDFSNSRRLGSSYSLFERLEGIQRLVGVGLGNEDVYLQLGNTYYNSITIILLSTGYVGLLTFMTFALKLLKNRSTIAFLMATIYIISCFSSGVLYSDISVIYLSVVLYLEHNNYINSNKLNQSTI